MRLFHLSNAYLCMLFASIAVDAAIGLPVLGFPGLRDSRQLAASELAEQWCAAQGPAQLPVSHGTPPAAGAVRLSPRAG